MMRPTATLTVLAISTLLGCDLSPAPQASAEARRHIRYGFVLENSSRTPLTDVSVDVAAPAEASGQRIVALSASIPFELSKRQDGERRLRFQVDLPPFGIQVVEVDATVAWASTGPALDPDEQLARYGSAGQWIESDAPPVTAAARGLAGGDDLHRLAASAAEFVASRLSATPYSAEPKGAIVALASGQGDCTEFAHLVVALLRARRVPARVVTGFALAGDARPRAEELHDWAEYFADGAWHALDAERAVIRPGPGTYLALRLSPPADEPETGEPAATPLLRAPPGVSIRLN